MELLYTRSRSRNDSYVYIIEAGKRARKNRIDYKAYLADYTLVLFSCTVFLLLSVTCFMFIYNRLHSICDDEWIYYKGSCYYLSRDSASWLTSMCLCKDKKASLIYMNVDNYILLELLNIRGRWINTLSDHIGLRLAVNNTTGCAYLSEEGTIKTDDCTAKKRYVCHVSR